MPVLSNHSILSVAAVAAFALFQFAQQFRLPIAERITLQEINTVVIDAPIQVFMYAGDRFFAANVEAMRAAAVGTSEDAELIDYRIRARNLVSELNGCHEDNYYLANAILTWGGAVVEGNTALQKAVECRFWDEFPPFFLGFNYFFFNRDYDNAIKNIDIAAMRSDENRTPFQSISIAIATKKLDSAKMAAAYLRAERDATKDQQLIEMLDRRLGRVEGLITLQEAQRRFEEQFERPLNAPDELLSSGILTAFPDDPLRLGYEFADNQFRLRTIKIGGVEVR